MVYVTHTMADEIVKCLTAMLSQTHHDHEYGSYRACAFCRAKSECDVSIMSLDNGKPIVHQPNCNGTKFIEALMP
jgi:hypothetical protein